LEVVLEREHGEAERVLRLTVSSADEGSKSEPPGGSREATVAQKAEKGRDQPG